MFSFQNLENNLKFLIIEVKNQVNNTYEFLSSPEPDFGDKIISRDDYVDNLKNHLENDCFAKILSSSSLSKGQLNSIRAMHTIAVNLERIGDFCVNIVRQMDYLTDYKLFYTFDYSEMFEEMDRALTDIIPALRNKELSRALSVCRSENNLDIMYKEHFESIMAELQTEQNSPGNYITILFIFRYLERIGDSLLNIGEAILFVIIGEKIKINQFQALQETLSKSGFTGSFSDVDLQFIWGTRSGCSIGRVENKKDGLQKAQESIFKEGSRIKIRREKENIEHWQSIFPGLVPRIFSYHEENAEDKASILLELIPGCTLDEAVLTMDQEVVHNIFFILQETLSEIWNKTIEAEPISINYMSQILERLNAINRVHPGFKGASSKAEVASSPSSQNLLLKCRSMERTLLAPLSVFVHGDLNVNNIVYNHSDQKINFIDVHRSRRCDYLQDVSVFLVSNFRIPVFEAGLRSRLNWLIEMFFDFVRFFAEKNNDKTFYARLAFALARSFYTSTRFELEPDFAREMFLRAQYLMERLVLHNGKPWKDFHFSKDILYY